MCIYSEILHLKSKLFVLLGRLFDNISGTFALPNPYNYLRHSPYSKNLFHAPNIAAI